MTDLNEALRALRERPFGSHPELIRFHARHKPRHAPAGNEVPQGEVGEVVGRSPVMMNGYYNQPQKTAEAYWWDRCGNRHVRTGDVGRFDADGFLTLLNRKKDMIISGGFNVYPNVGGWANERLGKTQRLSAVELVASPPRSAMGKVLKRELRDLVRYRT